MRIESDHECLSYSCFGRDEDHHRRLGIAWKMIGKGSSCEHLVLASVSARAAELDSIPCNAAATRPR
jgi:hypothetical protein